MKLSGGRIQDEAKANQILIIVAVVLLVISFFIFFGIPGLSSWPKPLPVGPGIIPP